jgi:hypothetical protein
MELWPKNDSNVKEEQVCLLDPAVIAATSGILGSIVGALSSLGTTFMTQRLQARRERVSIELAKREELYGETLN